MIVGVIVGVTVLLGVTVGVGLLVGVGLAAIIGGQKLLSSKSEDDGSLGAEEASKQPPLIKNPF